MTTPIFELRRDFDAEITLGIGGPRLPIILRRLTRTQMEELEKNIAVYLQPTRGTDKPACETCGHRDPVRTSDEQKAFNEGIVKWFEETIHAYLTIKDGYLVDCGQPVIDGDGFIRMFHARVDVLTQVMLQLFYKNKLTDLDVKNSNSPQDSDTGSVSKIPTRGGDEPGLTARNAVGLTIVPAVDAMASSDADTKGKPEPTTDSVSSGASDFVTKVH